MKHTLSFLTINVIEEDIAEIIVNPNVELTLEMVEEYDALLSTLFEGDFGLLINRVNHYTYSFEAKLSIASVEGIKAMAVINYNQSSEDVTNDLIENRAMDQLNIKQFSGLDMGRASALEWLHSELAKSNVEGVVK